MDGMLTKSGHIVTKVFRKKCIPSDSELRGCIDFRFLKNHFKDDNIYIFPWYFVPTITRLNMLFIPMLPAKSEFPNAEQCQ